MLPVALEALRVGKAVRAEDPRVAPVGSRAAVPAKPPAALVAWVEQLAARVAQVAPPCAQQQALRSIVMMAMHVPTTPAPMEVACMSPRRMAQLVAQTNIATEMGVACHLLPFGPNVSVRRRIKRHTASPSIRWTMWELAVRMSASLISAAPHCHKRPKTTGSP